MEERLQKIMAQAGYGSRRSCEELIEAGRVLVNGKRAELGTKADPAKDHITIDSRQIEQREKLMYIALNKPRGVLSDVDPNDPRPTVRGLIPVEGHLFAIGRLDLNSEGLILMTNDGMLANKLTHPRYGHEKEYKVLVATRPDDEQLKTWRRGVVMEDGYRTAPAQVEVQGLAGKGTWLRIVLREGRKRQIREVGKRIGLPVAKILRVRIGTVQLGGLKSGEWRHLTTQEVESLKEEHRGPAKVRPLPESRPMSSRRPGSSGRPQRKPGGAERKPQGGFSRGGMSRGGFNRGGLNRGGESGPGDNNRAGRELRSGNETRSSESGPAEFSQGDVNRGDMNRGGNTRGRNASRGQAPRKPNGKSLGVGTNRGEGSGRGTAGRAGAKRSGPPGPGGASRGGTASRGGFNRGGAASRDGAPSRGGNPSRSGAASRGGTARRSGPKRSGAPGRGGGTDAGAFNRGGDESRGDSNQGDFNRSGSEGGNFNRGDVNRGAPSSRSSSRSESRPEPRPAGRAAARSKPAQRAPRPQRKPRSS